MNSRSAEFSIKVTHEWGRLKEVVVGRAYMYMPEVRPPYLDNFLSDDAKAMFDRMDGKTLEEVYPDLYQRQVEQIDHVIDVLEGRGTKCTR